MRGVWLWESFNANVCTLLPRHLGCLWCGRSPIANGWTLLFQHLGCLCFERSSQENACTFLSMHLEYLCFARSPNANACTLLALVWIIQSNDALNCIHNFKQVVATTFHNICNIRVSYLQWKDVSHMEIKFLVLGGWIDSQWLGGFTPKDIQTIPSYKI